MKSNQRHLYSLSLFFFITLLNVNIALGQGFIDRNGYQLVDVSYSTMASGDIDGDGDLDLFISGNLSNVGNIAKIYFNDGEGGFLEDSSMEIEGLSSSISKFSDLDGDSDLDLIISGINSNQEAKTDLYLNDGKGKFTKMYERSPFVGLSNPCISIADIDNDLDNDIFITGYDPIVSEYVSKLYINNGSANFSEQASAFIPLAKSSASFGDIDNDGDQELIVSGALPNNEVVTHVYENINDGIFRRTGNDSLLGTMNSTITLRDFDLDNDLDLLIIGNKGSRENVITKLYLNNGFGIFEESWKIEENNSLEAYAAFSDLNGDNYTDIIYISPLKSVIFINLKNGSFQEVDEPIMNSSDGSVLSFDVDNDGLSEILVSGREASCKAFTTLYSNDGSGSIKEASKTPFLPYFFSNIISGDIDNDNDLDVIIKGYNASDRYPTITIYENNGDGIFIIKNDSSLKTINNSQIAFIDANGDQYLDVIMTGLDNNNMPITKLMLNNKAGSFEENMNLVFPISYNAKFIIDDIDLDGDNDILISDDSSLNILENKGSGEFKKKEDFAPQSLRSNSISFIDIDGDSDSDILEMGGYIGDVLQSNLYINDGNGNFQKDTTKQFKNSFSFASGDIDGDGDQDIIIAGATPAYKLPTSFVKVMINKSNGEFEELASIDIPLAYYINLELEDIDGDGDQDLLMTGIEYFCDVFANIYLNNGNANFQLSQNTNLQGIYGSYAISDFDGDLDMDIILAGNKGTSNTKGTIKYFTNDGSLCTASNYTNSLNACDSITWIDGKTYTNSNNSALYYHETSSGCDSIINLDLIISYSSHFQNTVTATGEYQWIDGNTYYDSNNTATYTLTNQSGCDSTVSLNLTLIPLANELESSVTLFPNPSGEQLKFDLGHEPEENLEYQIFNTSGLEIKTWESNLKEQVIDIRSLPSGTYIIKYQEGIKSKSLKFVKR